MNNFLNDQNGQMEILEAQLVYKGQFVNNAMHGEVVCKSTSNTSIIQGFTGIYNENNLVQKTKLSAGGAEITITKGNELEGIYYGTSVRKWQEGNRANQETIEGSFDVNGYPHGHCKIIITGLRSEEVQADLDYGSIVRKYSARRTSGQEDYSQGYNSQSCNCIFQNGDETHGYRG